MKPLIHLMPGLMLLGCAAPHAIVPEKASSGTGVLLIRSEWTDPQCGGALLTEEQGARAVPWQGEHLIRSAEPIGNTATALNDVDKTVVARIRTDSSGRAQCELPAGTYIIIDADRSDMRMYKDIRRRYAKGTAHYAPADTACLRQWMFGPFRCVTVQSGDTLSIDVPKSGRCDWDAVPCRKYLGPMPP